MNEIKATLQRWGNSNGIRIPRIVLDELKWNSGDVLQMEIQDGKVVLEPYKKENKKSIQDLFAGFEEEYVAENVEWGEAQGKEVW